MTITTKKMNPEVKDKWLVALRSGEYTQTQDILKNNQGFCCLGVLCDLHSKETNTSWGHNYEYLGFRGLLPDEVVEWAGVSNNEVVLENLLAYPFSNLVDLNDNGASFSEIANIIERHL